MNNQSASNNLTYQFAKSNFRCVTCNNEFDKPMQQNAILDYILYVLIALSLIAIPFTLGGSLLGLILLLVLRHFACAEVCPYCGSKTYISLKGIKANKQSSQLARLIVILIIGLILAVLVFVVANHLEEEFAKQIS